MIPCETTLRQIPTDRYRRLAGPFQDRQASLFDGLTHYLRTTGARIATVTEPEGACVWRLRSECETLEQTAARLRKLAKKR